MLSIKRNYNSIQKQLEGQEKTPLLMSYLNVSSYLYIELPSPGGGLPPPPVGSGSGKSEGKFVMTALALLHKRTTLILVILFIFFFAFTADILDLREELYLLSCPYSSLDNNVSTGLTSNRPFKLEQIITVPFVDRKAVVPVTFLHLLPYGYRAPPSWS
jgi:hypothetical protein